MEKLKSMLKSRGNSFTTKNILMFSALLSTAVGFLVFSAMFTTIPLLYDLNVFADSNLQPNDPGVYTIVEMSLAAATFAIGAVGTHALLGQKAAVGGSVQYMVATFYTLFLLAETWIVYQRTLNLGYLSEYGIVDAYGCNDTSIATGCPTSRAELTDLNIVTKTDCSFNVYNLDNVNGGTAIDWSNKDMYDYDNNGVLVAAAQNAYGDDSIKAKDIGMIHHCYYWGCSEACNDRYRVNRIWLFISIGTWIMYIILMGLSFGAAGNMSKDAANYDSVPTIDDSEASSGEKINLRRNKRLNFR